MAESSHDAPLSVERMLMRRALDQAHGDKSLAARLLGINQIELQRLRTYGLTIDEFPGG